MAYTGLIWLRIVTKVVVNMVNEPSGSIKCWDRQLLNDLDPLKSKYSSDSCATLIHHVHFASERSY
jgi:hypothetical protein